MKSTKECYQALIDGKKLRHTSWPEGECLYFDEKGRVVAEDSFPSNWLMDVPEDWEIYEETPWISKFKINTSESWIPQLEGTINQIIDAVNKLNEKIDI